MHIKLLDQINFPSDLKSLNHCELKRLAHELREEIISLVSKTGGHLSSNLGIVELTLALHYVFNTPYDRIIWDIGHQSYIHKILTGRRFAMKNLRKINGISGFPKRSESEYDPFGTAHSSTSISAALGMAVASRNQNIIRNHIAVIGDSALSSGMAFEALNNISIIPNINLLVILNDNDMSISKSVGALNHYLARLIPGRIYNSAKKMSHAILRYIPSALKFASRFEARLKNMLSSTTLFEELGLNYFGPIYGHDLDLLISTLNNFKNLSGTQFLHIITKKGQGYKLAEENPVLYHGPGQFNPEVGVEHIINNSIRKTFTQVFSDWICDMAQKDSRLIGITPAMCEGSGLVKFERYFPSRYFDVGIAEQHAITFAAGMACEGLKPVVAIYSTFLQRGYDQLIHDVALQNLDVTFAIDRAGLVGSDGATHAGNYDVAFLRCIPNMIIATPSEENETRLLLSTCYNYQGPASIRYPRGIGHSTTDICSSLETVEIGKGFMRVIGKKIAILGFGNLVLVALKVSQVLNCSVADMRFVKPIDKKLILELSKNHKALVTLEDATIMGGAGSAVTEILNESNIQIPILQLGLPDRFIDQGDQNILMANLGLDANGIESSLRDRFADILK